MEQITSLLSICAAIILGFSGCSSLKNISEIKLNQVGYYPQQEKVAIWEGKFSGSFKVIDATTREWVMENKAGVNVVSPWND
ncbi:MAG: cellulase N-terminal Ig-like domain-containing protein, partial [Bacteroides graminisolvens]|uniref:cellulase N-terminal Ig-like domain-containing protein n=1 Tax=Bacteroides graminisolvens TaxID=477666 RepID=UPI003A874702